VWQLTTIARHYMHTLEMKKRGFIKNKVCAGHCYTKCGKAAFIPFTYVYQPTLESDEAWGIQSQHLRNITYEVKFPFTKISCCTCEWAL